MLESQNEPVSDALHLPPLDADDAPTLPQRPLARRALLWWRMRWNVVIGAVLVFIVVVAAGFGVVYALGRQRATSTQRATIGTLALTVPASGPLQTSVYSVTLPAGSKISAINVKVGDQVTPGQTLATLDSTALQDAANEAQAAVNAAQTSLANAETNLGNVQSQSSSQVAAAFDQEQNAVYQCTHERTPPPACIAQAEEQFAATRAQAGTQRAQAAAQLSSAQAQLVTAQAQLQTTQHNLARATVTAPHAGTVAAINGTAGSGVAGGSSGTAAFISIADLSALQVVAAVSAADVGSVTPGSPVTFTVNTLPHHVFHGTVSTVSPLGQTSQNGVTFPVTITVDNASVQNATLLPGMTAHATITTMQRTQVILIPVSAVTFAQHSSAVSQQAAHRALTAARQMVERLHTGGPDISTDNPRPAYVLVPSKSGWVTTPVVLGLTDGNVYEVLAGLRTGDVVVTPAT